MFPANSRVIFTGDSITAHTKYTTYLVDYYRRSFPERNIKFYEGAIPGARVSDAIKYFEQLILTFKPTHATVFFGINDSGREYLDEKDNGEKHRLLLACYETYKSNLAIYLDMLLEHHIIPILITPAPYAEYLPTGDYCLKGGQRLSYEYAEVVRGEAKRRGLELIDLHAHMAELYLHHDVYMPDRVHPSDYGHYRMAEYILRCQGLEIGAYRSLETVYSENPELKKWAKSAFDIGSIYGMYVCIEPELYEMPVEEQLHYVRKKIRTGVYDKDENARFFSREFAALKPEETDLFQTMKEYNGE